MKIKLLNDIHFLKGTPFKSLFYLVTVRIMTLIVTYQ